MVVLLASAVVSEQAFGTWSRGRLMSANGVEQALAPNPIGIPPAGRQSVNPGFVSPVDLSADGRYVVFDTVARNLLTGEHAALQATSGGGVFRRAVDGGLPELVAPASNVAGRQLASPSVSGDGRYIAFDTSLTLVPEDGDTRADVYVRDMSVPLSDPSAMELVSRAPDDVDHRLPGDAALSHDGRRVLFATSEDVGPLVVADLTDRTLTTVSETAVVGQSNAALSGDGTTVAWIDDQPRSLVAPGAYLPGESPLEGTRESETEGVRDLLWLRVGEDAPARRVATTGDAEDPQCPPGTPLPPDGLLEFTGPRSPCDGPFSFALPPGNTDRGNNLFEAVRLSGNGRHVAYAAPFPRRTGGQQRDAFVRDMGAPGGVKATTADLTRFTTARAPDNTPIQGGTTTVSMSDDARFVAITTLVERSALAQPTLVSPTVIPGTLNIYVVDRQSATIERVTRGYDGADPDRASDRPVLSGDGTRVAFRSGASNLIFGDSNGNPDVYVADAFDETQAPLDQVPAFSASAPDVRSASEVRPAWRMSVTVSRGGAVLYVDARVPAGGHLEATARRRTTKAKTVVARATKRVAAAGLHRVRLRLPAKHRRAARGAKGLPVRLTVRFRPTRGTSLTRTVDSTYRVPKTVKRGR